MCVIATSYKGFDVPAKPTMKKMYNYNPDGAGFAYALNKRVYIEKGFMTYDEFDKAMNTLSETLQKKYNKTLKDISIMFHFRIGTHGPNSPELTHPFPISHRKDHFDALDLYTDVVMAHNGIIHSVTPNTDWSDTTQYVKDILHPMYLHDKDFYKSEHLRALMKNTINGSRFVFLDKLGEFSYVGDWHDSDDHALKGVKFSNLNHEDTYYSTYYSPNFNYDKYTWGTTGTVSVKRLPDGVILCKEADFDLDFMLKPTAKLGIVGTNPNMRYYVDYFGEIYHVYRVDGDKGKSVTKSVVYNVAFLDYEKPEDFDFLTIDSLDLIDVPVENLDILGYVVNADDCLICE